MQGGQAQKKPGKFIIIVIVNRLLYEQLSEDNMFYIDCLRHYVLRDQFC